ncbi:Hym1p [Malassezia yamatoensis]|uniref:Hym1p n=1 Tax=Malassezia yamatoensis TaxID=253288 RepID=A0AAJ5YU13_9BASI|nr:Hym1p [Malassezia yamatoensis]
MNFLFKPKQRSLSDLVRSMRDDMTRLGVSVSPKGEILLTDAQAGDMRRRYYDDLYAGIQQSKQILYGEAGLEPVPENIAQLAQDVYQMQLLQYLEVFLPRLEFETRKDVVQIFSALLQRRIGTRLPTVEYITSNPSIVLIALKGYEDPEIALNTGMILHEMLQFEPLAKILLYSDEFYQFPYYIDTNSFGISCDAFANFKETLVRHRDTTTVYLEQNYAKVSDVLMQFFYMYNKLLESSNYVTKRQSLKLLGSLLVDRAHYNTMLRYVADESNLKRIMNLLRDRSRNIQLEAFNVFKVFVANPQKAPAIEAILQRNRNRLLTFLGDFLRDRTGRRWDANFADESFIDERQYVSQIIA